MEQLSIQCSICLELPVSPVTTSCGHNFCMPCLTEWKKRKMTCPECNTALSSEPLRVNIVLRDMIQLLSNKNFERGMSVRESKTDLDAPSVLSSAPPLEISFPVSVHPTSSGQSSSSYVNNYLNLNRQLSSSAAISERADNQICQGAPSVVTINQTSTYVQSWLQQQQR